MNAAFEQAQQDGNWEPFEATQFKIINVLFHEMAHVFFTYLNQGRENTPPNIDPRANMPGIDGEAGRALEIQVFGGIMCWWHQSATGTSKGQVRFASLLWSKNSL